MKIHLVKDKAGKTIATFEKGNGQGPQVVPVLKEGHTIEEAEVPENYRSNLEQIYK